MFHPIKRCAIRSFLTGCVILSLLGNAWADYGKIAGRVTDKTTGTPLPGANVMIESIWDNGKVVQIENKQGASCDEDGRFVILNVSPNIYNIKATMIGYTPLQMEQVIVNIGRTITVNFELEQSSIEMEAVRVVAQREVIKPDVYGTQEVINVDRLSETPVMRVDEFVSKIKGVELVSDNDGNGLSVRGGEVRETDVRIDGMSARDPRSENSYLSLNSTSVAELQVLTGGFEAKYGGFRSGLVNVVTKEGSRDKISISLKIDNTTTNDYKFFGTNQWSKDSWIYKVFSDTTYKYVDPRDGKTKTVCYDGFPMDSKGQPIDSLIPEGVPEDFWTFKGWSNKNEGTKNYEQIGLIIPRSKKLTAEQKRKLWETQHPLYKWLFWNKCGLCLNNLIYFTFKND